MGLASVPALWFLPFVIPIAVWAAYSDLSRMKIPNKSVLALMAVFIAVGVLALPFAEFGSRILHFAAVLLLGFAASAAGLIGAGDAKFAAAMAPFFALQDLSMALFLLAGCVIFGFVSHRLARAVPAIRNAVPTWQSWSETKQFPMGYPLALTLVVYLALRAF